MLQKTVSVIVPVYNATEYLHKCVDSIVNQSYVNLEIILVDDGSVDESLSICEQYACQDKRIKVLHKENGGLMSAWMAGVELASGEYFCFVDSDDWIDPCMIGELFRRTSDAKQEVICCNFAIEKKTGSIPQKHELPAGIYEEKKLDKVKERLLGNEIREVSFSRCMKLISRELILDNLCYCDQRIRMGEDVNIMLPALLDTKRLVILEDAFYYHYYFNESSMVHRYDKGLAKNIRILSGHIHQIAREKSAGKEWSARLMKGADREELLLWLLALKNEARGNPSGYRRNILKLCRSEEIRNLVKRTEITVNQPANKLLYLIMKHPGEVTVRLLRLAMIWYYRS